MALSKIDRLRYKKDFEHVFKEGDICRTPLFFVKARPVAGNRAKFGIVVSKKISKKAVWRNKIRRRLGESIRKSVPVVKIPSHVVIIAQSPSLHATQKEMEGALRKAFKTLNIT